MGKTKMGKEKRKHRDEEKDPEGRTKRKAAKKVEKVAKMLGYTNETNPFGDSNLLQPFVWGKKKEVSKEVAAPSKGDPEKKRLELLDEINKVRKRREDREKELEEMDRLRNEEMRLREAIQFGNWQEKEEEFHIEQTRVRSKIRLAESREQPIDVLAKNIILLGSSEKKETHLGNSIELDIKDVEVRDPVGLIESLNDEQMAKLRVDIQNYLQLSAKEEDGYEQYWSSMKAVVDAIVERRASDNSSNGRGGIHSSLRDDVDVLLKGKDEEDLRKLQQEITNGLRNGTYTDTPYWEAVAKEIDVKLSRLFLSNTHKQLLERLFALLNEMKESLREDIRQNRDEDSEISGSVSRRDRQAGGAVATTADEVRFLRQEEERGLEEAEEKMRTQDEISLPRETYWWQDRYRPRKPRYFNRVRTGFDWNKYNQTHYDKDNPPPKIVQGYRFAIFYPDLIDNSVTPQYFIEKIPGDSDFVVLRFHAGPPYEDIAFRIVNKPWDTHRKSGFRCVFERGVLQLNFSFHRVWYRR